MHRVRTSGASFALRGGYPVDETPFAFCAPPDGVRGRHESYVLLALVEPLFPAPGAGDAAAAVIRQLTAACEEREDWSPTQLLLEKFQAANEQLFRDNATRALAQRIHLGVTAVIARGRDVTIGQVPPGHLLVRQNDSIFTFPYETAPTSERPGGHEAKTAHPLGLRTQTTPNVYVTRADTGDLFVALSTELARSVSGHEPELQLTANVVETLELVLRASERQFVASGQGAIALIPAMMPGSQSATVRDEMPADCDFRYDAMANDQLDDTTDEFIVRTDRFSDTGPLDPLALKGQTKSADTRSEQWQGTDWSEQIEDHGFSIPLQHAGANRGADTSDAATRTAGRGAQAATSWDTECASRDVRRTRSVVLSANTRAFGKRTRHAQQHAGSTLATDDRQISTATGARPLRGTGLLELLAGLILSLTAAVVGAWQVTKRDRPLHGPLDDGAFGLPRLQRWDESYRPPRMQRVRSRLPRLEVSRVVILVAVVLVLALSVTYYLSRANSQAQQQTVESLTLLQQAESQRVAAVALADPQAAYAALLAAEATLAGVAATDTTDADQIAGVRAAIAADITRVTRSQRLSNVQVVGGVPSAPASRNSQLVIGGNALYLLADGVYQVDLFTSSLVQLLKPGDLVDGAEVGMLQGATWREDRLIATDATRSYAFDITRGIWVAEPLATIEGASHSQVAAIATFDRNLYMLVPEGGQILKFQAGAYDGGLEDWTAGVGTDELKLGIDMAIDGHVLVLLNDGRILDFLRSRLEQIIVPQVLPALEAPVAIAAPVGSAYLYLLHGTDGRILRMTKDGTIVQQFTSPVTGSVPILSGATDMTVDEVNGIVHVLARDTIYTIRLPAPPAE